MREEAKRVLVDGKREAAKRVERQWRTSRDDKDRKRRVPSAFLSKKLEMLCANTRLPYNLGLIELESEFMRIEKIENVTLGLRADTSSSFKDAGPAVQCEERCSALTAQKVYPPSKDNL